MDIVNKNGDKINIKELFEVIGCLVVEVIVVKG